MQTSVHVVREWIGEEQGVTSIEYALLGSLIAIAVLGGIHTLGGSLGDLYDNLASRVTAAMS
ncbi:pilus assembly protein Flp/PilA [Burkholderia multivorans]